jgi:putative DNA methylase
MRKLIEVALPLEAINNIACKADQDRKTGTIRSRHKWFAPMPPPAWRALLAAALLNDPGYDAEREELFKLVESLIGSDSRPPGKASVDELHSRLSAQGTPPPVAFDLFCGGGSTIIEAQHLGVPAVGRDLNQIPVLTSRVLGDYPPRVSGRLVGAQVERLTAVLGLLEGFAEDV